MRTLVVVVVTVLLGLAAPARAEPGDTVMSQDLRYGAPGQNVGYALDATSYYDFAYTFELAAWPTAGAERVRLGGLSYTEHKGVLVNLFMMLLGMDAATHKEKRGNTWYLVTNVEQQRQIVEAFSKLPMSLSLRLYDESVGSEMDGYSVDIGLSGTALAGPRSGSWHGGVSFGSLTSNASGAPPVMPVPGMPTPERVVHDRGWFGGYLDLRLGLSDAGTLGARLRLTFAWADPFMILAEAGPELFFGNRVQLRVYGTADALEGADGLGARAELGVRF